MAHDYEMVNPYYYYNGNTIMCHVQINVRLNTILPYMYFITNAAHHEADTSADSSRNYSVTTLGDISNMFC